MEWIKVSERLPEKSMKVRVKHQDGVEDVGFYKKHLDTFFTCDPVSKEDLFGWKPFDHQ